MAAPPKRAKHTDDSGSRFVFTPVPADDEFTDFNRKRKAGASNLRDEDADNVSPVVPISRPGLLKEMSAKMLHGENLRLSMFAFLVIRETESLLDQYSRTSTGDGVTTVRDIERLERRADDFALKQRATTDVRHRARLWVARCKLVTLRKAMESASQSGEASTTSVHVDAVRGATRHISDEMLARWLFDNDIGSAAVVRFNAHAQTYEHSIDKCGLAELWALIKSLRARWPYLPLSPFLYVALDKLRERVAFFMSYREPVNQRHDAERGLKTVKILGLARSNWRVADPEWVRGGLYDAEQASAKPVSRDSSLINSPEMMTTIDTRQSGTGAQTYACISNTFIEETERVLNSMLIEIRKCAGFEWHEHFDETEADCHACAQLSSSQRVVDEMRDARVALEKLISSELTGNYRQFIQTNLREEVWDSYVQPGEREMFHTFRPLDNDTSQGVILRSRREDGKNITRRFCEREIAHVWRDFTETGAPRERDDVLIDYSERGEPAYSLLTRLTMGYYLDAKSAGAKFYTYCIDCHDKEERDALETGISIHQPFLYNDERFDKHRTVFEFHTALQTTGTLRWRYKHQPTIGMRAPAAEIYHEHPLILKTMASFCVLYNGRMHLCNNFADAFLVWLATMCEDATIGGELHTEFSLLDLYEQVFVARRAHIATLRRTVENQKRRWNPMERLYPHETLSARTTYDGSKLQF